jgi:hypothetical protein
MLVKAVATLRGIPADIAYRALYDTKIRMSWDKVFSSFEVVDSDDSSAVLYYVIKAPIGITNREFL